MSRQFYNQIANDFVVERNQAMYAWEERIQHLDPQERQELEYQQWKLWEERTPVGYDTYGFGEGMELWLSEQLQETYFVPNEGLKGQHEQRLVNELETLVDKLNSGELIYEDELGFIKTALKEGAKEFYESPLTPQEKIEGFIDFIERNDAIYNGVIHSNELSEEDDFDYDEKYDLAERGPELEYDEYLQEVLESLVNSLPLSDEYMPENIELQQQRTESVAPIAVAFLKAKSLAQSELIESDHQKMSFVGENSILTWDGETLALIDKESNLPKMIAVPQLQANEKNKVVWKSHHLPSGSPGLSQDDVEKFTNIEFQSAIKQTLLEHSNRQQTETKNLIR
jgi:hypothetical protein